MMSAEGRAVESREDNGILKDQQNPWQIHVDVWQKPLQYCKVNSLQLIKIKGKKKIPAKKEGRRQGQVRKERGSAGRCSVTEVEVFPGGRAFSSGGQEHG